MWAAEKKTESDDKVPGERIMGELVRASVVLLSMAVDPHGKWVPMMDSFLFSTDARQDKGGHF